MRWFGGRMLMGAATSRRGVLVVAVVWVALGLGGCTDMAHLTVPTAPVPSTVHSPEPSPAVAEVFDATCQDLLAFGPTDEDGYSNANHVGVLWQTYHSHGRAYEPPSKGAWVNAGGGYWVVAAVIHGETSAWLAWGNAEGSTHPAPYGQFGHWAEIKAPASWDGGSTPFGSKALASALRCVGGLVGWSEIPTMGVSWQL